MGGLPVAGELIVFAKYSIKSQTCSELTVTYHPLDEGDWHPPRSIDLLGHQTLTSWWNEERDC